MDIKDKFILCIDLRQIQNSKHTAILVFVVKLIPAQRKYLYDTGSNHTGCKTLLTFTILYIYIIIIIIFIANKTHAGKAIQHYKTYT